MTEAAAKRFRLLASAVSVLLLLAAGFATWFYFQLRASLPQLDGARPLPGLTAALTVTRDALGVPTVRGATRLDVARGLGFLHAQERFFQMDLLRRSAAGELSALVGAVARPLDRSRAPHRFRALADTVLASLPPADRALLEAYTAGVNTGLAALGRKPFEYFLLRTEPAAWRPTDSLLVVYAMTLDLQDASNTFEHSLSVLRDRLGPEAVAFFAPLVAPDDAALDGSTAPLPPIPGPALLDLRHPAASLPPLSGLSTFTLQLSTPRDPETHPGSNSFALAGVHTANGSALLANDPHLSLRVPNIWYRAVLAWPAPAAPSDLRNPSSVLRSPSSDLGPPPHRLVGATIPGLPFIVVGSNGSVAWGLTVAYADTADLVAVDLNPVSPTLYKIPGRDDLLSLETHRDTISVKGAPDETVETSWTVWGPVVGHDAKGRPLAQHWVAYDPAAANLDYARLETATTAAEAVAVAHRAGIPAHNFLVADRAGAIAWTIAGKFPARAGFDGRLPTSWSYGDRRWTGFVAPDDVPTVSSAPGSPLSTLHSQLPPPTRLWTANNRVVGGSALALLGDAGYDSGARAGQIRDDLATLEHARPADLLAIQLDDRALLLAHWQQRLLAVLTPEAIAANKSRAEFRRLAEHWEGHASVDSVSYRLVRGFRTEVARLTFTPIFAACTEAFPAFDWHSWNYEAPLRALLDQKPAHLLAPNYPSWEALQLAAVDAAIANFDAQHLPLADATWGRRNTAKIHHPFGAVLPLGLGARLNLPADPLPGDTKMPRVQGPDFGASLRLVVSPGHEDEGLFTMPGGQSGHPLSPYYRAGHTAWVRGEAAPLLPGPTEHTLTLTP